MQFHHIDKTSHPYFDSAWSLYESAFPTNEKRTKEEQEISLCKNEYSFMVCYEEEKFIGILSFWEIEEYIFIEHFAIDTSLRGQNYGSRVLTIFLQNYKNVFLEIDLPTCKVSQSRLKFYEKLGFVQNDIEHIQLPFRKDDISLSLAILSWKIPLDKELYGTLYQKMNSLLPIKNPIPQIS